MKIISQGEKRISVELTREDMEKLDITYDELDYSNIETRRVLWTLLDRASHTLGCDIDISEKMIIEAVPCEGGGCVIYFTVTAQKNQPEGKNYLFKRETAELICETADADDLLDLIKYLDSGANRTALRRLYTKDGAYRLVVSQAPDNCSLEAALSEFGNLIRSERAYALASTDEKWTRIM